MGIYIENYENRFADIEKREGCMGGAPEADPARVRAVCQGIAKVIFAHVVWGRAASPFAAVCLPSAWNDSILPSCRGLFARRAGD